MVIPCEESKYKISNAYKFVESTKDGYKYKEKEYSVDDLEYINKGARGVVWRLVIKPTIYAVDSEDEDDKPEAVAIKYKRKDIELEEIEVDALLKRRKVVCDNMIQFKVLEDNSVSMPLTDGDLWEFLKERELTPSQASEIVQSLAKTLHCLTEKGIYYFDIKQENILYRCDRKSIRIYLGDLGSMLPREGRYMFTYLPVEYQDIGILIDNRVKEQIIVFLLCGLYYSMVSIESFEDLGKFKVTADYRKDTTSFEQGQTAIDYLESVINYEGRDKNNETEQIYRDIMLKYIRLFKTVGEYGKSADRNVALRSVPTLGNFLSLFKKRKRTTPSPILNCPKVFSYISYDVIDNVTSKGGRIMYNGKLLTKRNYLGYDKEEISSGTYGVIYKISINSNTSFILKQSKREEELDEVQALKKIGDIRSCPGLIKTKVISSTKVVMPVATGDLQDFKGKVTPKQADYIVTLISKSLQCLHESEIYYFDMKLANVLYRCERTGVKIYLGDLGSVIPIDGEYMASYPPVEYYTGFLPEKELTPDIVAKIYTYQMCIMYYSLLSKSFFFLILI